MFGFNRSTKPESAPKSSQSLDLKAMDDSLAMAELNLEKEFIRVNDTYAELFGHPAANMLGQSYSMNFLSQDKESAETRELWSNLLSGKPANGIFRRRRADGSEIWISATYTPVRDAQGQVTKFIKIASDVTKLYLTNQRNENLIKAADRAMAVIEFDLNAHVINANENFLATTGYSLSEIKGNHHRMFCDSSISDSPEYRQFWNRLQTGEFISGRFERRHKDGSELWLEASYNPIMNSDGEVTGFVKFATDITESVVKTRHESESASTAYNIASETKKVTEEGARVVQEAAGEMEKVATSVSSTATELQDLGHQSDEISSIVNTIRGIADQTNLLALNAAIEAARAGDQGRGFAVVADEVRQLAARTSNSTEEISGMINKIQEGTNGAITSMSQCLQQAEHGKSLANQAEHVIGEIRQGTQEAVDAVSMFAKAVGK